MSPSVLSQRGLVRWCGLAFALTLVVASFSAVRSIADPETPAPSPAQGGPPPAPAAVPSAVREEVLQIGDPEAYRSIDLYLDFIDQSCAQLVQLFGEEMRKQIEDRKLVVNLRLVSYLDPYSASSSYSSRALIAAYLVTGESGTADIAWKFVRRLFDTDVQPQQGALKDLTDQDLANIAHQIGAPDSATEFIATGQDRANVDSHQIHLRNMGRLTGLAGQARTPVATYRGHPFSLDTGGTWLAQLVATSSATPLPDAPSSGFATGVNVPNLEVGPDTPVIGSAPPGGAPASAAPPEGAPAPPAPSGDAPAHPPPPSDRGLATGVNVPHQELQPGVPLVRPSQTLPPSPPPGDAPAPPAGPGA